MSSTRIASIFRPDLREVRTLKCRLSITDVKHLASYNWIESDQPTIAVPGCPSLWSPPKTKGPKRVPNDSRLIFIAQNAFRHPESPLEPLFRSLYIEHPWYDMQQIDMITDRNNIRKLLSFINPRISSNGREPFTINVETTGNITIFCRSETETHVVLGPGEYRGHGHEFEKAYTRDQVSGSTGHYRIISYSLGDLKCIVRYETDGFVGDASNQNSRNERSDSEDILGMMENLSLSRFEDHSSSPNSSSLVIQKRGQQVTIHSTLEIKTRVAHKPIPIEEVLPQLWVSQTPNLVRAYHRRGTFEVPKVEDVTKATAEWEKSHDKDIGRLILLIKEIIKVLKENGGKAVVRYDGRSDSLSVSMGDRVMMLPDDLYVKIGI
ncbi:hypothetical protein N7493_007075 [Penicillium malachiteum]|uniref:Geranylgeranyl pyrophosphate synthetase n=1 Tax=Penicillium malachiteum TaxID=1324776 RepID=A0AAD6HKA1_9EURO|nr:hypothetical protein N7493_007075 [Penicillium malachiteum]